MKDRENSLIIGLAIVGGGIVMLGIVYILAVAIDAGDGLYSKNVSAAMAPTLLNGDYVTSRRLDVVRKPSSAHRGDLVIHKFPPDPAQQFIKRLIGLPGDTLAMKGGLVLVNQRPLSETYTQHTDSTDPVTDEFRWQRAYLTGEARLDSAHYAPSRDNWGPLIVPPGQFFVLGDNRTESLDSRWFGFVSGNDIVARVRRIYFSRDVSTGKIRWSRLGRFVH